MTNSTSQPQTRIHPGSGRKAAPLEPKGRQVSEQDLSALKAQLGQVSYARDELIEYLHVLQDQDGGLYANKLAALAELMQLSLVEVYEVATFYLHFDVIDADYSEDAQTGKKITVRVCDSLSCMLEGGDQLAAELKQRYGDQVRVQAMPCMGRCQCAPVAEVGHNHIDHATFNKVTTAIDQKDTHTKIPAYQGFDDYCAQGGYQVLRDCYQQQRSVSDCIQTLKSAQLRGLGGAGFPTGMKWEMTLRSQGPRLMAVNGDEGEPGTFKDRHYLESKPHAFLEGMLIAAWAVEAERIYVYIRDEYPAALKILDKELMRLQQADLLAGRQVILRRGAGAYICGEESAMLESLEGKRGYPRQKPPYPTQVGLFGQPTLIHNIETLYWIPQILDKGAQAFACHGASNDKTLRSYSVSGHVNNPQVVLAPAGTSVNQLIALCGGMKQGHSFKGYLPGGASGGILPASLGDAPLDFGTLEQYGCFIGSAAVVVLSDQDDLRAVVRNLMAFFERESCGQCTPCRVGTQKMMDLLAQPDWNTQSLHDLMQVMRDASICGLGQAASNPVACYLKYFA